MKRLACLAVVLLVTQIAWGDYVMISGSNDTNNSTQSIIRYGDDFQTVWERSARLGDAEPYVNDIALSPLDPNLGGGDIYTAHYGFGAPTGLSARHYDADSGAFIGQVVPSAAGDGQLDGTGTYLPQIEGRSAVLQDIEFGPDYNGDGIADLWAARRDWFEIYDGTTLNREGLDGTADLLTFLDIADAEDGTRTGTGAFGFCFGLDLNGDGVGEMYAMRGINAGTGSRLNVWDPMTLTQIATYNMDGIRDNSLMMLGPDVDGDGDEDLWVADARSHRLVAIDCATGEIVSGGEDADDVSIPLQVAGDPAAEFTMRFPVHVSEGSDGSVLVSTRFASSLDADWAGGGDVQGGNLLRINWDADNQVGLVTLLYEHMGRLSGAVYIEIDKGLAHYPSPLNGAIDVARDAVLTWEAGSDATAHDVYFGTDANAVSGATVANPLDVLVSEGQAETTYDPGTLDFGQTYYWRVDEVTDAGLLKGSVWSFTVGNFILIEDFESYNDDDDLIYDTWLDGWVNGTGSTVGNLSEPFAEQTIVHYGSQSMPVSYDNFPAPYYSEATREWATTQNWTADGAASVSLWLFGLADNSVEPLYLVVEDSSGTSVVAEHPDATAVLQVGWQEWSTDLSVFTDGGVDLASVASLTIGIGDRAATASGFTGTIYVDDVRLYLP